MVKTTNATTCTFKCVEVGVYLFTVLAVNVLGKGKEANITVTGEHKLLLVVILIKLIYTTLLVRKHSYVFYQ